MHAIEIDVLGCKATPQKSAEEVRMEALDTAMRLDPDKIILNCANDRMETAARSMGIDVEVVPGGAL